MTTTPDPLPPLSEREVIAKLNLQGPGIRVFGRCAEHLTNPTEPNQPHVCLMVINHREGYHLCGCGRRWPTTSTTLSPIIARS